jgi:DNA-binding phage protein
MQDHDRQFLYDLLRFVMAASGVGVVAKVSQMPK